MAEHYKNIKMSSLTVEHVIFYDLLKCIQQGDAGKVRKAIRHDGRDPNFICSFFHDPTSPFFFAVSLRLMAFKTVATARNASRMATIRRRRLDVCRVLLANGANPNLNIGMACPIDDAVFDGDLELVKLLLAHGANANPPCKPPPHNPPPIVLAHILWAASNKLCYKNIKDVLISAGAVFPQEYKRVLEHERPQDHPNLEEIFSYFNKT